MQHTKAIVIGDVGSGKTYVALLVAYAYFLGQLESVTTGIEVCLIAPTEVLAFQHYQSAINTAKTLKIDTNIDHIYLASSKYYLNNLKISKSKIIEYYKSNPHRQKLVIGTHALFYTDFLNPDLVLVDEQHKFGVEQRGKFYNKPHHFISFTATPIPRSLALSMFNNLPTFFLDRIEGRAPIKTVLKTIDEILDQKTQDFIKTTILNQGHKLFVVCSRVKETKEELNSNEPKIYSLEEVKQIFEANFGSDKVLSLHGKDKQKQQILLNFKNDPTKQILISTSVIEVGIDISEARMVIIVNAERFGLSALHQLRGRVGRNSSVNNFCILATPPEFKHHPRLKLMTTTQDGFELAKYDLEHRGSGLINGTIQSGFSDEVNNLLKLDDKDRSTLINLVKDISKTDLQQLPRLDTYLQSRLKKNHLE
jgi:ATP-dependent DNA helicase RecG